MNAWDMNTGKFYHQISKDKYMDSDGKVMHVTSNHTVMDMNSGEIHFVHGLQDSSKNNQGNGRKY